MGKKIEKMIKLVIFVLMLVMVILVFTQVLLRFLFSSGVVWSEELVRYIFVWLMFLGITLGIYKQKHIGVTSVATKISKYIRGFGVFPQIIMGVFFVVLTWEGTKFTLENFSAYTAVLPIKLGYIYSIIPIAGLLSIIFIIFLIVGGKEKT